MWSDNYLLGIDEIDQQHKKWMALVQKFSEALLCHTIQDDIYTLWEDAYQYTHTHFKYEEEQLALCCYPELDKHKKYHEKMNQALLEVKSLVKEGLVSEDNDAVMKRVDHLWKDCRDWLIHHINEVDRKYVKYLK